MTVAFSARNVAPVPSTVRRSGRTDASARTRLGREMRPERRGILDDRPKSALASHLQRRAVRVGTQALPALTEDAHDSLE
jgi:hypothetical protein